MQNSVLITLTCLLIELLFTRFSYIYFDLNAPQFILVCLDNKFLCLSCIGIRPSHKSSIGRGTKHFWILFTLIRFHHLTINSIPEKVFLYGTKNPLCKPNLKTWNCPAPVFTSFFVSYSSIFETHRLYIMSALHALSSSLSEILLPLLHISSLSLYNLNRKSRSLNSACIMCLLL